MGWLFVVLWDGERLRPELYFVFYLNALGFLFGGKSEIKG